MNNEEFDIIQRLTDYIYFEEKLTDSLKYAYVVEEMQLKKKKVLHQDYYISFVPLVQ